MTIKHTIQKFSLIHSIISLMDFTIYEIKRAAISSFLFLIGVGSQ